MTFPDSLGQPTSNLRDLASALDQVGIVVPDLDAVEAGMRAIFGLEPRSRSESVYTGTSYRGRTIDTRVGALFYDLFGIELEFLSPRGGPDIWQEFQDEHGPGLHHIRFAVEHHDTVVDAMAAIGIPVHQEGDSVRGGGVRYAYFDARPSLGFFVEILSTPPG
ncbi:MAG: VOC family protein [Microbacterium sp.]|jgi:catechol 2,3-dioxygenase-like lactoylglutathione lyase family enzyme|uniref:VOC family protein n=1 Tax=Microbacterium sp. TaxID=51671 RepID=UPI0025EEA333|nr:VOC family protein [Microbacterium sp.]MBQ9916165.1 VOC family protein [Microbacterium sp.]